MIEKINLEKKFSRFSDRWSPKLIGELNGQHVKIAKVEGEFTWHHHEQEDELFLVVKGQLTIQLRDGDVDLGPGEMLIVPRGVEHRPVANQETHIVMFEPASTLNTGNVRNDKTVEVLDQV